MGNLREAALSRRVHPAGTGRAARWGFALTVASLLLTATGCVTTENGLWPSTGVPEKPSQVVCIWENNVMTVADSANGGVPVQGFAGRVYLFDTKQKFTMLAEGMLTVDLIDESCDPAKWVERWNIDTETLQRLKKEDMMGWGYTVFLPSKEYRPDMTKIKLKVAFQMPKCPPLYTENPVTLAATNGVVRQGTTPLTTKSVAPATQFQPPIRVR